MEAIAIGGLTLKDQVFATFDDNGWGWRRVGDGAIGIADVSEGGAAQRAGLVAGGEILAVDGRKAGDVAIHDLREAFRKAPGTRFHLHVRNKAGIERNVELVLASQV